MSVQLSNGVHWINPCYEENSQHEHVSVYLLEGAEGNVLIDSGSYYHRDELVEEIAAIVGAGSVGALVLSHTDYPHAANVYRFQDEWGPFEIVANTPFPEFHGLPEGTYRRSDFGKEMDIGGRTVSFLEPPLADRVRTVWIYDHPTSTLFTADGLGHYHGPATCDLTSDAMSGSIEFEHINEYHAENIPWFRYADPDKLRSLLQSILGQYDIEYVAPAHGNPVHRDDLDEYLDLLIKSASRIADAYTVPAD